MSVFLGMLAVLLISAALTAALVFAIYRRQQKVIKVSTRFAVAAHGGYRDAGRGVSIVQVYRPRG